MTKAKPWINKLDAHHEIEREFCFIEGYMVDDNVTFGRFVGEGWYLLDDGDCREPEELADLGDKVHFFDSGLVTELLKKHFCK